MTDYQFQDWIEMIGDGSRRAIADREKALDTSQVRYRPNPTYQPRPDSKRHTVAYFVHPDDVMRAKTLGLHVRLKPRKQTKL